MSFGGNGSCMMKDSSSQGRDMTEFCIKLSMATIEGRPLSVSLARFGEPDTPLIGVSPGFLHLSGLSREDVVGRNCRFLNQNMSLKLREKLRHSVKTGMPFMGVLDNRRHVGGGVFENFENLLHLVVVVAGNRSYFLGIQANVTGLNLDLESGSRDAMRLQKMFDGCMTAGVDSWIHIQEGALHALPLYLYIRHSNGPVLDDEEQVELVEGALCGGGPALAAPDQYLVLAPRFAPQGLADAPLKWQTHLLGSVSPFNSQHGHAQSNDEPFIGQLGPPSVEEKPCGRNHGEAFSNTNGGYKAARQKFEEPVYLTPPKDSFCSTDEPEAEGGLKNQLRSLVHEDPASIIVARGITKLGLHSSDRLQAFFSQLGDLKEVHVPCVFKKRRGSALSKANKPQEPRIAGRCFVVMNSPQEASKIIALGPVYVVDGVTVTCEPFNLATSGQDSPKF